MNFRGIHGKAAGSQSSGHYHKPLSEGNFNTFWFFGRLRFGKQADAHLKIARASSFSAPNTFHSFKGEFNEIASFIKVYWVAWYDLNKSIFACLLLYHRINQHRQHLSATDALVDEIWATGLFQLYFFLFVCYQKEEQAAFPVEILQFPELGGD